MNEELSPDVKRDNYLESLLKLRDLDPAAYSASLQATGNQAEDYDSEKQRAATASKAKKRILCIDDNEDNCFMLTTLLGSEGYEAKSVDSVQQALEFAREDSFNLYVLDSWLSEGDGTELCQKIREFDSQTPIIFYSGAAYESDRRAALQAGANAFVVKPNIDVLLKTVNSFLS